jgi:hypothetical protein
MTYEDDVKVKALLRRFFSHGLIKDSSCASELISGKEDAEELKWPIPISAASTYNPTLGIYCNSAGTHVISMVEAINGNINHLSKFESLHYSF